MKKHGPCFHCGTESTPLWRNGPPEKPVLCNACGSRYRLGKPLENYTPKSVIVLRKKKKRRAVPKAMVTQQNNIVASSAGYASNLQRYASSESSTSHNQNLLHMNQQNEAEIPAENWESLWGSQLPSRRRSPVLYGRVTSIQKLQMDLHNFLRDEGPFIASEGPEDVLIYNENINKLQIPSTEIGLGSILLKFPATDSQEQEIEPSSSNTCGKHSPSLAKACSDGVNDGIQNELYDDVDDGIQNACSDGVDDGI